MPYTEESKILINNLFDLKAHNGKRLVRVSQQRLEHDAAPTQVITLILLTNWCYTKMAR